MKAKRKLLVLEEQSEQSGTTDSEVVQRIKKRRDNNFVYSDNEDEDDFEIPIPPNFPTSEKIIIHSNFKLPKENIGSENILVTADTLESSRLSMPVDSVNQQIPKASSTAEIDEYASLPPMK